MEFEALGCGEQKPRGVTPSLGGKRNLAPERVELGALMVVQWTSFGASGEFQCGLERAGLPFSFSGRQRSGNALLRVDCEFGCSFQECRRGGDTPACLGSTGRDLQFRCHVVVGMPGGLRAVPGAPVRVGRRVRGLGKRSVRVASVSRRRRLVDSRTDKRVAENDSRRHLQQTVGFNSGSCGLVDPEELGGGPHQCRIARGLGGRHKEQATRGFRELRYPSSEARLKPTRHGDRRRQCESAGQFDRCHPARQFEQGKGVAACLGEDALGHTLVERVWKGRAQEGASVRWTESMKREVREACKNLRNGSSAEHERDSLRPHSTSRDCESLRRLVIKPLGVVNKAQDGGL
jgi:hypothetical protein